MSDLVAIDPYTPLYQYEKMKDPSKHFVWRSFDKKTVQGIDNLVVKSRGRQACKSQSDWDLMDEIVTFFMDQWPEEWKSFRETIPDIRQTRGEGGYSQSHETLYLGAIPNRLERLIAKCFPELKWDKKFVYSFVKRYKIFKVAGMQN